MKKLLKQLTKKSFALFMTVVMLMSCWVWFVPEKSYAYTIPTHDIQYYIDGNLDTIFASVTTINGKFGEDSSTAVDAYYDNVLYSPTYTCTDDYTLAGDVAIGQRDEDSCDDKFKSGIQSGFYHFADTTMMYDGSTTVPKTAVILSVDPLGAVKMMSSWLSNANLVIPSAWKEKSIGSGDAQAGDCALDLPTIMLASGTGLNNTESATGDWSRTDTVAMYANTMEFKLAGLTEAEKKEFNETNYYVTINPSFYFKTGAGKYGPISTTGSRRIRVINYKPVLDAITDIKGYINTVKTEGKGNYSEASLNALANVANLLIAAHPNNHIGASKNNYTDYSTAAKAAISAYNEFKKTGLVRLYTITWNIDGKLETAKYAYGVTPSYNGTPTKAETATTRYVFNVWNPTPEAVTKDATYTATWTEIPKSFTITFKDWDGSVFDGVKSEYLAGEEIELPKDPTRAGYRFTGWDPEVPDTATGAATFIAQYVKQWTVTFVNWDNTTLHTDIVDEGKGASYQGTTPSKANDANNEYIFTGWDKDFSNVTSDLTVKALYSTQGHTIVSEVVEPANCTKADKVHTYCSTCYYEEQGDVFGYHDVGEPLGHTFDRAEPTFDTGYYIDDNEHTLLCKDCGAEGSKRPHNWIRDDSMTEGKPTCNTEVTYYYFCECGGYKEESSGVDSSKHLDTEIINVEAPTCEEDGYTGDLFCNDCQKIVEYGKADPKLGHKYTKYVYNEGTATCFADGTETATCDNNCGETDTRPAAGTKLTHEYTNYTYNNDAKCEKDGTETAYCNHGCGTTDTRTAVGTAREHIFEGTIKNNGNGTHSYECTYDDCEVYGGTVNCSDWVEDGDNCKCEDCGYTKAHAWGAWAPATGNTGDAEGDMTRTCADCKKVETKDCEYVQVDHKDATCTAPELTRYECSLCGHGYTVRGNDPLGHDYTGEIKYNNNGTHSYLCANGCGTYGFQGFEGAAKPCNVIYTNNGNETHDARCEDGCGNVKDDVACSGGTAYCNARAICEFCNTAYGTTSDHSYTGTVVYIERGKHAYRCVGCDDQNFYGVGDVEGATEDCFGGTATCKDYAQCEKCTHEYGEYAAHDFNGGTPVQLAGDVHAYKCSVCTEDVYGVDREINATEACSGGTATCKDLAECTVCKDGHGNYAAHVFNGEAVQLEGDVHAYKCSVCTKDVNGVGSVEGATEACSGGTATCKDLAECTVCKDGHGDYADHVFNGEAVQLEGDIHAYRCSVCERADIYGIGSEVDATEACSGGTATCKDLAECTVCKDGHGDYADHVFDGEAVQLEGDIHAYRCSVCERTDIYGVGSEVDATEPCSGGTATCIALAVCDVCNDTHGGYVAHVYDADKYYDGAELAKAATCITQAEYYVYCSVCKKSSKGTNYEATFKYGETAPHDYSCQDEFLYIAAQAKCGVNAKYYFYCSNPACKKSSQGTTGEATFDKPNTALTHNWVNPVNNNNGTHTYSCSQSNTDGWVCDETNTLNCEDSKTLVSVKAPTCTAVGYTTYKCTICEYTWKADETDPLGHDYTQQIKDTAHIKEAATCENGDIYWYDCSRCDKNAKNEEDTDRYTNLTYQVNNKRAHKWQNKVDAKYLASEATCTAAAKYYTSCAYDDCGKSSEEVNGAGKGVKFSDGKALGHNWIKPEAIDKYKASDADCVTDATYYYICSRADKCGCESSKGIKKDGETWTLENSKTGHDFDHADGHKAATAATCTTAGNYEYYLCEKCDKYFKDADGKEAFSGQSATVIKALGHDIVTVTYVKPTCETDGTPAHKYCKRCDYTTMPSDLSPYKAKGHNFAGALKYDSENDYHSYLCLNKCGESGMIINGVQTKYAVAENGTVTGGEKCTFSNNVSHYTGTDGKNYHAVSCKCGNKDSELCADTSPEVIAPTCSMDGYTLNTCEDCGYTWKTDVVSKETHTPEFTTVPNGDGSHTIKCIVCDDETLVACSGGTATCKDYAKCSVCGGEYGKKPGHTLSADGWVSNNDATCTEDGTKSQICSVCNEKVTELDVNSKLGHDMSAYDDVVPEKLVDILADANIVIKAPTCKEEGFTLSYCSRCDVYKTKTEPRNTNAHVFPLDANGEIDYTPVGGNCATGVTMKAVCSVCLAEKTKVESVAHTWKVVEKVAAGCVDNGFIKYACTACPATRTLDEVTMVEIEKIEDEDGNVSYKFDDVIVSAADYNDVVAKGKHTLGDLVTVKEATCGRDGKGYRICSVCPEKVEEVIYATGEHRMTVNKGKAATCTTMGWEDYESCVVCGMEEEMTYIAATGHVDGNNDNVCDSCKGQLGNVVVEKEDGCICHKDSGFMKFMYKFLLFFWKLFKINKTCLCGAEHY